MNEEFFSILKYITRKRMELSLIQIGKSDSHYSKVMSAVIESGKAYESLEIDEKSRTIIDKMLQDRDAAEMEQASIAYLAGIRDCILILSRLELFDF